MSLAPLQLFIALSVTSVLATSFPPLRNFQVAQPIDVRDALLLCTVELLHHTFGNSYGRPAIVDYAPPPRCGDQTSWSTIALNLTATSNGTQYDRLATLYLSHTEILRTSTAEPTHDGIVWTVVKEVTRYAPLFASPGPLLLDLGNLLDPARNLTGEFDVSLSVSFYAGSTSATSQFDIIPLSSRSVTQANYFDTRGVTKLTVPKNAVEAYVEIYASGNALEEFWYTDCQYAPPDADSVVSGPYREVQLLINGILAGIFVPYPVIYTGGVIPTAWRPIAAYGAFDEPTYVFDITPLLPVLCDDALHDFELRVIGQGEIKPNWWISGSVRIVRGATTGRTTGKLVRHEVQRRPDVSTIAKETTSQLFVDVRARRRLVIESLLQPDGEAARVVRVEQDIGFINEQQYSDKGLHQMVTQSVISHSNSLHGVRTGLTDSSSFTLYLNTSLTPRTRTFAAAIAQTFLRVQTLPPSFRTRPHRIETAQNATGSITLNAIGRVESGRGETEQSFDFAYLDEPRGVPTYWRNVKAANATVVKDRQGGVLAEKEIAQLPNGQIVFGAGLPPGRQTEWPSMPPRFLSRWLKRPVPV